MACRSIFAHMLCVCLCFSSAPVSAQVVPGQWVGDLYSVNLLSELQYPYGKVLIDENDGIREFVPNAAKSGVFPVPLDCSGAPFESYWRNGALYTWAEGCPEMDGDGATFSRLLFAKWEDGEWGFLGDFKNYSRTRGILEVIPCGGGRFIVVSDRADLMKDDRPDRTPFCLIQIPEGRTEARIEASIAHGQDGLSGYMANPVFFKLACFSDVAVTDSHAVLVNGSTGIYWVFSLEKASLVKAGCIFKSVTPEVIAKGGFGQAVLRVNPEKSGTVLLAAQEESLLMAEKENAEKEWEDLWKKAPLDQRYLIGGAYDWIHEIRKRREEEIRDRSPLIVWYRIHPENGRVEKLTVPPEGGSSFREGGKNDHWRPMPDGSVRMGIMDNALAERSATDQTVLGRGGKRPAETASIAAEAEDDAQPNLSLRPSIR